MITFGDNVRVIQASGTERLKIAARVGVVHGETTPSVTNVQVIGEVTGDHALNVHFDALDEDCWLAPEHHPGPRGWGPALAIGGSHGRCLGVECLA